MLYVSFDIVYDLDSYQISIFFALFISSIIIPSLFMYKKINIFEPVFWFSIYYSVLILSEFIMLSSDFTASTFVVNTSFYTSNILELFSKTIWIILIGYIALIVGYYLIVKQNIIINFNISEDNLSILLLKIVSFLFMFIGASNFLYNLYIISGFDIISYFQFIHYNAGHFVEKGVTIIGYNFLYPGILFLYYLYIHKKVNKFTFYINMLIFFVIVLSLGRVTGFAMTMMLFYLISLYSKQIIYLNKKKIFGLMLSVVIVFSLFFIRMYSDFNRVYDVSVDEFMTDLMPNIGYILLGEGNLPNVGIVMKIIDSWANDIGYLYGGSIFLGLLVFTPSFISKGIIETNTVSWLGKHQWYDHIHGGSLPPTIIGDLYSNFGFLGVLIGMFILGLLFAKVYNFIQKKKGFFIYVFYLYFLLFFVFILPKGEFSRFSFILIPIFIMINYYIIKIITIVLNRKSIISLR